MNCDRCGGYQSQLHQRVGTPPAYYCCSCNGCDGTCPADRRAAAVEEPADGVCIECGEVVFGRVRWWVCVGCDQPRDMGGRLPVAPPLGLVAGNRRAQ